MKKGKLTSFTYSSWWKFISFAAKWGRFQCKEGEIALASESKLRLKLHSTCDYSETSSSESLLRIPAYCKFHRECYNRFCNIRMLGREEDRKTRRDKQTEAGMYKQINYIPIIITLKSTCKDVYQNIWSVIVCRTNWSHENLKREICFSI